MVPISDKHVVFSINQCHLNININHTFVVVRVFVTVPVRNYKICQDLAIMTLPLINSNILWCHRSSGCETCKSLCWLSSYGSELIQNLSVNQLHFSIFSDFLIWNLRKTIHQGCHLPYFLEFSRTQNRIQIFHLLLEECPSFLNQTLLPEKKKEYHLSTSNFYIYWQGLKSCINSACTWTPTVATG